MIAIDVNIGSTHMKDEVSLSSTLFQDGIDHIVLLLL